MPGGDSQSPSSTKFLTAALFALLVVQLSLNLLLLCRLNVHWDEFHFLAQVFEHERGAPLSLFQTFHVHLFAPLAQLELDEIALILSSRLFMLVAVGAALLFLYRTLARFGSAAALFSLLAISSFPEMMIHGASFRSDPLLYLLFCAALAAPSSTAGAVIAGAAGALALLLNLKASILIGLFLLFRFVNDRPDRRWWSFYLFVFVTVSTGLFLVHSLTLGDHIPTGSGKTLRKVFHGFLLSGFSPAGMSSMANSAKADPLFWIAALSGLYIFARSPRTRALACWSALPIPLCLLYRNAWPYFFSLAVIPFAFPLAGCARWWLKSKYGSVVVLVAALLLSVQGALRFYEHKDHETRSQAALVNAIHQVFPEPVPYIDRCGMISSFPSAGPFLTSWNLERYRQSGQPLYPASNAARFLIANSPVFFESTESAGLPATDRSFIESNFVQWWGPLYLRGVRIAPEQIEFGIQLEGIYQLTSEAPVVLDNAELRRGENRLLHAGTHSSQIRTDQPAELVLLPTSAVKLTESFPTDPLFRY